MPEMKDGTIVGHEFMGMVSDVGKEVKDLKVGDRVVVAAVICCGECEFCKREEFSACQISNFSNEKLKETIGQTVSAVFGFNELCGGVPGGQAEFVRVPFADVNCLKLPESVPDESGLFLSDIIPTSYFGVDNAEVKKGDVVAVWGLGPVGLLACRWCQIRGAKTVIGIDSVPERLDLARSIGVDVINFADTDVKKTLTKLYPRGVDAGIECAGVEYAKTLLHKAEKALGLEDDASDILTEIIQCVRPFGKISIVGVYVGMSNHFPIGMFMMKGQTMRGGHVPLHRYWKDCLKQIESGAMDPRFIVTTYGRLSEAEKLYKDFYDKKDGIVKILLRP